MTDGLVSFSMAGTPLLAQGQTMELLARTPRLWLHVKVYADGGENAPHSHPQEDHAFLVLDGEATFEDADGGRRSVGRYDGLLVPRGVAYSFRSTGATNLVMLRVGADASDAVVAAALEGTASDATFPLAQAVRVHPDGSAFPPTDRANRDGARDGVPRPGATFGG